VGIDVVQRLDRRGFLAAAATVLAASAGPTFGQTLIQGTPRSDTGFTPPTAILEPEQVVSRGGVQPATAAPAQTGDWRRLLLQGERVITMRRDGGVERVRYCTEEGQLDRQGYAQACQLLRDVRAGKLFPMDPHLLDLLCGLQRWAAYNGHSAVIQLLSGFRSQETNANTEGAALNSMHLYGRAADIVLEGFSSALLGAMVREFNVQGGNGIYLNRGFVHVDTGAARSWVSTTSRVKR
jgi:uncharacterized protein YcbK (DUF882 family)